MKTLSPHSLSILFGLLGVAGFSLTLPATRLAVAELDPTFVGLGRAIVAALIAGIALAVARAPRPVGMQWLRLGGTAIGVVIGFPLLSTWAMTTVPAAHGGVVVGLIPLVTALFGAWLAGERPRPLFWVSTIAGSITIAFFSLSSGGGSFQTGDFLLLGAVIAAGFGYAEGARLSRELGAWQTISWALVISAPILLIPALATMPHNFASVGWQSLCGFAYVSVVSMFLAFVVWYKGLALGGIARIGQLQLLQPFLTIFAAAMLLGEQVSWREVLAAGIVIACVLIGRRAGATRLAMQEFPAIRKAVPTDALPISQLIGKVAHYFSSSVSGEVAAWFQGSITPSAIAANISNPGFNYLVGFVGQKLAGVIALRDTTQIHHLFVASEFHRQGVAAKLWKRAQADAFAAGNRSGFSVRSSEYAVPVYEHFGFRVTGARAEKDGIVFIPMYLEFQHKHG